MFHKETQENSKPSADAEAATPSNAETATPSNELSESETRTAFSKSVKLATSSNARLLLVEGDHDLREAMAPHAHALVSFLHRAIEPATPAPRTGAD